MIGIHAVYNTTLNSWRVLWKYIFKKKNNEDHNYTDFYDWKHISLLNFKYLLYIIQDIYDCCMEFAERQRTRLILNITKPTTLKDEPQVRICHLWMKLYSEKRLLCFNLKFNKINLTPELLVKSCCVSIILQMHGWSFIFILKTSCI